MSKAKATPVHTSAQPEAASTQPDPYHGIGGEYVRDPITGLRSPAPTADAADLPADPAAPDFATA